MILCIPASYIAAGRIGGTAHLIAVASAWIYNYWLKKTLWSVLPYVVSFGLVAPFLTYGLTPPQPPAIWFTLILASLGLAAGMSNGIPDIDDDQADDTGGLVARLGARASAVVAALAVVVATGLLVAHLGFSRPATWLIMAAVAAVTIAGGLVSHGRHLFKVVMVLALMVTALLCTVGATVITR